MLGYHRSLYYFGASFISPLPWKEQTERDVYGNETVTMDASIYFTDTVLHQSDSISHPNTIHWDLFLCLTVCCLSV